MIIKALRQGLGCVISSIDVLTRPAKKTRSPEAQAAVDQATANLSLYQFQGCPFCIKVRRHLHKLNITVALKDTNKDPAAKQELLAGGGKGQVPCLRIQDDAGETRWLYESDAIIRYLDELDARFSPHATGSGNAGA